MYNFQEKKEINVFGFKTDAGVAYEVLLSHRWSLFLTMKMR